MIMMMMMMMVMMMIIEIMIIKIAIIVIMIRVLIFISNLRISNTRRNVYFSFLSLFLPSPLSYFFPLSPLSFPSFLSPSFPLLLCLCLSLSIPLSHFHSLSLVFSPPPPFFSLCRRVSKDSQCVLLLTTCLLDSVFLSVCLSNNVSCASKLHGASNNTPAVYGMSKNDKHQNRVS